MILVTHQVQFALEADRLLALKEVRFELLSSSSVQYVILVIILRCFSSWVTTK